MSSTFVACQPRDSAICTVLIEHQRDVRIRRLRIAEQPRQIGLPRRRRQQVVTAHHLVDARSGVIHHHRKVVRRHPVAASDHEIVDGAGVVAVQQVVDGVHDGIGAQPQRRWPPCFAAPLFTFGVSEVAARARIRALRSVRCLWRLRDIPSGAETFVQVTAVGQFVHYIVVALWMFGLPFDRPVPSHADRRQIRELPAGHIGMSTVVEIFDAHQETTAARAREQPRQYRGPQVADVQVGRRARREPARSGCHALSLPWSELPAFARPPTRCPLGIESRLHAPAR
jgi:hypothetical protein